MTPLRMWLSQKNEVRELFEEPVLPYPSTPEEYDTIFHAIECELSPENLSCDGELPRSVVERKTDFLYAALHELEVISGNCYT